MPDKAMKSIALVLVVSLLAFQGTAWGAPIPSKMTPDADGAARLADLARARSTFATASIEAALLDEGLTTEQVRVRMSRLSSEDVAVLGRNVDQIRSAGISMSRRAWIITGVVVAAVAAAIVLNDDDDDDSDDGED